jgi:hypothetical protein
MEARYFTVDQANAMLPILGPLVAELLRRRERVLAMRAEMEPLLDGPAADLGGRVPSQLVTEFIAIEAILTRIRTMGRVVKDLNAGLVDFLSERDGRDVYLCWRHGEPRVGYFHDLESGFAGRQPLEPQE